MMKSKYIVYAVTLFMFVGQVDAMRRPSLQKKYDEKKAKWDQLCVRAVMEEFLPKGGNYHVPLSFEILGSKNFIAAELGRKLDSALKKSNSATLEDKHFKKIAECRHEAVLTSMMLREDDAVQLQISAKAINCAIVLSFIQSLEYVIKERIEQEFRTSEIEWRKHAYKWLNCKTGQCFNFVNCLNLDIEKAWSFKDVTSDYGQGF